MLSIIIPARNEAENLQDILDYFNNNLSNVDHEVILINDFSEDATFNKAKELFQNNKNFKVFNNLEKGLGGAINLGIDKATGNKVAIMMADLSDHIEDLIKYNDIIEKTNVDAVLGSRFIKGSKIKDYPFFWAFYLF